MRKGTRLLAAAFAACALLAAPEAALGDARLSGGGTADISQVAITVAVTDSGAASGSFLCLMAGRSAFALGPFGLERAMIVKATPTSGSVNASLVTFAGPGTLILDGSQRLDVWVAGWVDVAAQQFQLTVVGVGTLPVETLLTGRFRLKT